MDIEEFYDADDRRRQSAEIELGTDWHDQQGTRYELNWVEDTGELYVMKEPAPLERADVFGGVHVSGTHRVDEREVRAMTVSIVGSIASRRELEEALEGWEDAMGSAGAGAWLADRLRGRGVLGSADAGSVLTG